MSATGRVENGKKNVKVWVGAKLANQSFSQKERGRYMESVDHQYKTSGLPGWISGNK